MERVKKKTNLWLTIRTRAINKGKLTRQKFSKIIKTTSLTNYTFLKQRISNKRLPKGVVYALNSNASFSAIEICQLKPCIHLLHYPSSVYIIKQDFYRFTRGGSRYINSDDFLIKIFSQQNRITSCRE